MRITLVVLDGVFDTGLTAMLDAFATANALGARLMGGTPRFDVTIAGMRRKVRTAQGLLVPTAPVPEATPDWVVVPALKTITPATLLPALERPDARSGQQQLRQWRAAGARVGAACIGTFLLAEAGLLDHQEATTSWFLAPLFRQRYPAVRLDEARMLVPSESGVTAGAAMGHLDLALWLIGQASPELAALVARYLLADLRSSQAPYIISSHLAQSDPLILRFEAWARGRLRDGFSLEQAAGALGTTPRTLQRRCNAVLGKSPLAYFQDLRVERAQALLRGGGRDVETIAAEVGYMDGATLRTLLRQRLGRGVRELRAGSR